MAIYLIAIKDEIVSAYQAFPRYFISRINSEAFPANTAQAYTFPNERVSAARQSRHKTFGFSSARGLPHISHSRPETHTISSEQLLQRAIELSICEGSGLPQETQYKSLGKIMSNISVHSIGVIYVSSKPLFRTYNSW